MWSLRLFITIAFAIVEVFRPSTARDYNFSGYPSLQTRLAENNFNGIYNHDMKVRPNDPQNPYSQGYQMFLKNATLNDTEDYEIASNNPNNREYFCENKYPSYQFKIDVRQLVEDYQIAMNSPQLGLDILRQLILANADQFQQPQTEQGYPQSGSTYDYNPRSYMNPSNTWNPYFRNNQPTSIGRQPLLNRNPTSRFFRPQSNSPKSFSDFFSRGYGANRNYQPNRTTQALPEGSKIITRNGEIIKYTMPPEIPVERHSFEEPMGITLAEVHAIRDQVLEQANMYRARHGCEELAANENINNHAQQWANYLASSRTLKPRRSDENNIYGETLHASTPVKDVGKLAVDTWYNQLRFINEGDDDEALFRNTNPIQFMIQLLWKKSREIGIGVARSSYKEYFIVANYSPKGNIYPFLLDYLPVFTQYDIDTARKAHEGFTGKICYADNNQLEKPVSEYGHSNQLNHLKRNYLNSQPAAQSNYDDECPKRIPIRNVGHGIQYALAPEFKEPIRYPYKKPVGLTPEEVEDIRKDVLAKTNYYRVQKYGLKPLVLHQQIDNFSQEWANYLVQTNQFRHRTNGNENGKIYGENLYLSSIRNKHVGEVAVDLWYYEISLIGVNDSEEKISSNEGAGHLTQLLWKSSRQMGVGAAVGSSGQIVVAANYNPPGNVKYFYKYNLPKFTQSQINEGITLQSNIDKWRNVLRSVPRYGLPTMAGWKSQLYNDEDDDNDSNYNSYDNYFNYS